MSVVVVADSASDLPAGVAEALGVQIVPLTIEVGGRDWADGTELPRERFWELQAAQSELPKTAAPSSAQFAAVFERALGEGAEGVVAITLTRKLSATFQAAEHASRDYGGRVRVIDSETLTLTEGLIVEEAARLAASGADLEEVAAAVEDVKTRARTRGTLDTLENLRRGGRIGAAAALLGTVMSFKPMIDITDGEVKPGGRQRTRRRAIDDLVDWVEGLGPLTRLGVVHALADDVDEVVERVARAAAVDPATVAVAVMGATIGTHAGPRALGVSALVASR
ncbi:degV family protein [Acidimicrobium ferrooxidans DSM 10331]|uniref:DegV family protein n=1 Tax=Acidimicrobium ferrooxidans (strain DSM 10331 / JCM 15462 / NBRC 103882 / ICP) TaxID=525909 RepID=C7M1F4_ACIFD|nr:DegV family protein [Acidimicrobium ferrooxidans]ACU53003.1 degV family protein [Acidimicrobium ferrooxidans DSM 10331]